MKSYPVDKKNMARGCRVSATTFDRWGVTPAERKGREALYGVVNAIDNRANNATDQITDDKGEIDDDEFLRVRIRLLTAQVEAQELRDGRGHGDIIDTVFRIYVFSRLASQIPLIIDSLPLAMTRKFPDMKSSMLDGLKKEVIRTYNACAKLDENIPLMLSDHLMRTAENAPDKSQSDENRQRNTL